jgi:tRNA(fMet)-specific endonuclease VapC
VIILDTDHMVEFLKGSSPQSSRLRVRLKQFNVERATTIITVEEICRGWLAEIRRIADTRLQVSPYARLRNSVLSLGEWKIEPWTLAAAQRFEDFRKQRIRVGSADLKIACIALESSAILLTRNVRDFTGIPGLRVEDWLA